MLLKTWLKSNNKTAPWLAAFAQCSPKTIYHYCAGRRVPRTLIIDRIKDATNGAVTYEDHTRAYIARNSPSDNATKSRKQGQNGQEVRA